MGTRKRYQIEGITFDELVEKVLDTATNNNDKITQDYLDDVSAKYNLDNRGYEDLVDILIDHHIDIESNLFALSQEEVTEQEEIIEEDNTDSIENTVAIEKNDINDVIRFDKYQFLTYLSESLPQHESSSKELVEEYKKQYEDATIKNYTSAQTFNCDHIDFYLPLSLTYLSKNELKDILTDKYAEFFEEMKDFVLENWDKEHNKNTSLVIYMVAYFDALSFLYGIKVKSASLMKEYFNCDSFNGFVDKLYKYYEKTDLKYEWDTYYDFSMYESLIDTCESSSIEFVIDKKKYEEGISNFNLNEDEEIEVSKPLETTESLEENQESITNNDEAEELIITDQMTIDDFDDQDDNEEIQDDSAIDNYLNGLFDTTAEDNDENIEKIDEVTDIENQEEVNENKTDNQETTDLVEEDKDARNEAVEEFVEEIVEIEEQKSIDEFEDDNQSISEQIETDIDDKKAVIEELVEEVSEIETQKSVDEDDNMDQEEDESDLDAHTINVYTQTNGYDNEWIDVTLESESLTFMNDLYVKFNISYQTELGNELKDIDAYITTPNGVVIHPSMFINDLGPLPEKIDIHFNNRPHNLQFGPVFSIKADSSLIKDDLTFTVYFVDMVKGYKVRISYILEDGIWKTKEVFAYPSR